MIWRGMWAKSRLRQRESNLDWRKKCPDVYIAKSLHAASFSTHIMSAKRRGFTEIAQRGDGAL